MKVTVSSEKPGYLYLFYLDASGSMSCLFPNSYQRDNAIPAGKGVVTVPSPDADFRLRIGEPCGRETLKAVVSLTQVPEFKIQNLIEGKVTDNDVKRAVVEGKKLPSEWAEHYLDITTWTDKPKNPGRRRIGVFVGIKKVPGPGNPRTRSFGQGRPGHGRPDGRPRQT